MMSDDDDVPILLDPETSSVSAPIRGSLEESKRVPCTLISGFLGAGKSTLLRRILTEKHGYRIAVIMNEFGDTADIEAKAINFATKDSDSDRPEEVLLELSNGCLCCSIKDSGIAAIENLMRRKGAFDYIILETTGLADPGPIASLFWQNEDYGVGIGSEIYLDGVVCVVDAVFGEKQLLEDNDKEHIGTSVRQIGSSDVIILNKIDLVDRSRLVGLSEKVRSVNPYAPIFETIKGEIDLKHVLNLGAYSTKNNPPMLKRYSSSTEQDDDCADCKSHKPHEHRNSSDGFALIEGITCLEVPCPVLSKEKAPLLDEWIREVLWEGTIPGEGSGDQKIDVLRCKGFYTLENGEVYILQGVRNLYELSNFGGDGSSREGKLVFIGRGLTQTVKSSLLRVLS